MNNKHLIKKIDFNNYLNNYQKEIGVINYIPEDLEYENLGLIHRQD